MKYGMQKMSRIPVFYMLVISIAYIVFFGHANNPSSGIFILFLAQLLFSIGFIFGNLNALAMQPIGHIAGIGASIIGCLSTLISIPIAAFIGHYITTTALPIFIGFAVCAGISLFMLVVANRLIPKPLHPSTQLQNT